MLADFVASLHRIPMRTRVRISGISLVLIALVCSPNARAQATYSADRIDGISAFGTFTALDTDYGVNVKGYTIGGDLTHSLKSRWIVPSLEVRYTGTTGPAITESDFLGGVKVETHFHRLRPYTDFLVGYGKINYVQVNGGDNSIAYDAGVGLDYSITRQFAVKVDAQEQFWKLGQASSELTPTMVSFGIVYRVPTAWGRNK